MLDRQLAAGPFESFGTIFSARADADAVHERVVPETSGAGAGRSRALQSRSDQSPRGPAK